MSQIKYVDTDGDKSRLLPFRYFGLDNYPAGGDIGRVYVGTGTENIPLAKKSELSTIDEKADVHIARVDNPHEVTKAQVGLGNVDDTADVDKIVASAGRLTEGKKINNVVFDNTQDITIKSETPNSVTVKFDGGTTEGTDTYTFDGSEAKSVDIVAGINVQLVKTPGSVTINVDDIDASKITSGVIDAARLPSYVDDVLEFSSFDDFPLVGETGKIYVAIDTNKTYRWGGTSYVYITSGAVDSVAGKTGVVTLNKNDVELDQVDNTSDVDKPISIATANALALKTDTATLENLNVFRADKALASKNIARLIYESGNLTKIRYNIDSDVDYEVLTYSGEDLVNVAHYIDEELKGNTVLTYASDELVSSIFIGV